MDMKANVGGLDRTLRLLAGIALLALALAPGIQFVGSGAAAWVAGLIGVVLILTGTVRICPLYSLLGISTSPAGERS